MKHYNPILIPILLALLGLSACNGGISPPAIDDGAPDSATETVKLPDALQDAEPLPFEGERILFKAQEDSQSAWFTIDAEGGEPQSMEFPALGEMNLKGIRWVPELGVFATTLEDTQEQQDLYLIDAGGNIIQRLTNSFYGEGLPKYSPAAGKFAFECVESDLDICTVSPDGSNQLNLTLSPSREGSPLWSPSGDKVIFISNRSAIPKIWYVNADGTELTAYNEDITYIEMDPSWSPDGTQIVFQSQRERDREIFIMDAGGENDVNLTNNHDAQDYDPVWSPDGNWIAFRSESNGEHDLFVMAPDGTGLVNITNTPEKQEKDFMWSLDSEKIIYTAAESTSFDIFSVNRDGTQKTNLTDSPADEFSIQWIGN